MNIYVNVMSTSIKKTKSKYMYTQMTTRLLLITKGIKVFHVHNIQRDLSSYLKGSKQALSLFLKRSREDLFFMLEAIV